jgi:hypothetical protein
MMFQFKNPVIGLLIGSVIKAFYFLYKFLTCGSNAMIIIKIA